MGVRWRERGKSARRADFGVGRELLWNCHVWRSFQLWHGLSVHTSEHAHGSAFFQLQQRRPVSGGSSDSGGRRESVWRREFWHGLQHSASDRDFYATIPSTSDDIRTAIRSEEHT